jgi:cell division protein FtsL
MKGSRYLFIVLAFAIFVTFKGFSLEENSDSVKLSLTEFIEPFNIADTLNSKEADSLTISDNNLALENSETIFGNSHLLKTDDFSDKPINKTEGNEWFFIVALSTMIMTILTLLYFPYYSRQFFRSVSDAIQLRKIKKEEYFDNKTPKWLLSFNFLVVFALMVLLTFSDFFFWQFFSDLGFIVRFGLILGIVSVLFLLKRSAEWFFSWVFYQKNTLDNHYEVSFFFNNLTGILLLPLVIAHYYNPDLLSLDILWILLLFIVLLKIIRRSVVWLKHSKLPLFYIFLYLCAVELAPLLFLVTAAKMTLNV